jgi:hypothetical protein
LRLTAWPSENSLSSESASCTNQSIDAARACNN